MASLFQELKRRKVFRVAAVYTVSSWVLIQVADVVLPTFGAPAWVNQTLIFLFIIGLAPTLIVAWAYEKTSEGIKPDHQVQPSPGLQATSAQPVNYLILLVVLLVAGFQVADRFVRADRTISESSQQSVALDDGITSPIRLAFNLPENFLASVGDVSPDGLTVVMTGNIGNGTGLWLRTLNDSSISPIPGTGPLSALSLVGGQAPSFSPDGQSIVFTRLDRIETVSLSGDTSRILVEGLERTGNSIPSAVWGRDDMIYFNNWDGGIWRVPASGGVTEQVISPDSEFDSVFRLLDVLPDDNGILYKPNPNEIAVASLDTGGRKVLTEGVSAKYATTGHLLFNTVDGNLLASRFNLETYELSEETTLVQTGSAARDGVPNSFLSFALSDNGTLIYPESSPSEDSGMSGMRVELAWLNRIGVATPVDPGWNFSRPPNAGWSLSPNGDRIAYQTRGDIWIKDLPNGPEQRLTFVGGVLTEARHPAWSPDGREIAYIQRRGDGLPSFDLWRIRSDGTGDPRLWMDEQERGFIQPVWSQDGEWLIMRTLSEPETGPRDIVAIRSDEDDVLIPLVGTEQFGEQSPAPSPDGRWLAYSSDESGVEQVYVRPFPEVNEGRRQVSIDGGISPLWDSDGNELFYVDSNRNLVSARLSTEGSFQVLEREILFTLGPEYYVASNNKFYDLSPDDQRFLMARRIEAPRQSIAIVLNFFEELRQLAGEN